MDRTSAHILTLILKHVFTIGAIVALSGCGLFVGTTKTLKRFAAAEPIDSNVIAAAEREPDKAKFKSVIGTVLIDSEQRCDEFTTRLAVSNVGSNTLLDLTTTVLSAAATAVTPINTVHSLTAASTVSSGSKSAINSDVFAKATIANLSQAINATYYKDLKSYEDSLVAAQPDGIVTTIEIAKILSIHKECALDTAEAAISSTLGAAPQATPPATTSKMVTITLTAPTTAGDKIGLLVTATSSTSLSMSVTYTATGGAAETPAVIAKGLVAAIQSNHDFSQQSITATQSAAPNDGSFVIQAPASLGLTIQPTITGTVEKLAVVDSTAPNKGSSSTSGVVPGRSLLQ